MREAVAGQGRILARGLAFAGAVARYAGPRSIPIAILVALGAVLEGAGILLLLPLLANLMEGDDAGVTIAGWDVGPHLEAGPQLAMVLAAFAALMLVRTLVLWARDRLLGALQVRFVESLRASVARHLAEARWETLARLGHARVTHLMGGDVQRCGTGTHFLFQGGVAVTMLVVQAVVALVLAPVLAIVALALLGAGAIGMQYLLRGSHLAGSRVMAANLSLMTNLGRFLTGLKMAMSQNLQHAFVSAFDEDLRAASQQQIDFVSRQSLVRGMWSLLGAGVAGSVVLIGFSVLGLPSVVLIALLVVLWRIVGPAAQIHGGMQQIAFNLPAWEAVRAIGEDLAREVPAVRAAPGDTAVPPRLEGAIAFESAVYRHGAAEGPAGVGRLTLGIERGAFVAVIGASGSGKTTFADLLAGLLTPQSGRITVGGTPLDEATIPYWRERIAYVAQDPVLFNDSVRHNLVWGTPSATEADIAAALAVTGGDRLVARLNGGLEAIVGENGALISGGERQRLVLARALIRQPEILILDEATSAIDLAGEREILLHLRNLPARPTIVLITHRRESLAMCDRLLEFRDGQVVADTAQGPARAKEVRA